MGYTGEVHITRGLNQEERGWVLGLLGAQKGLALASESIAQEVYDTGVGC